jgi:ribosomal protein L7/L12
MGTVAWIGFGLAAFGLGFWLTRRWQRSQIEGDRASVAPPQSPPPNLSAAEIDLDRQVRDLLAQGRLIDAVKRVREVKRCTLAEAKTYVDRRLP